jgi:hypothetical protein
MTANESGDAFNGPMVPIMGNQAMVPVTDDERPRLWISGEDQKFQFPCDPQVDGRLHELQYPWVGQGRVLDVSYQAGTTSGVLPKLGNGEDTVEV